MAGVPPLPGAAADFASLVPFFELLEFYEFCVDKVKRDRAGGCHSGQSVSGLEAPWVQDLPHPDPLLGAPRWHA